jgi:hypothetical protein
MSVCKNNFSCCECASVMTKNLHAPVLFLQKNENREREETFPPGSTLFLYIYQVPCHEHLMVACLCS